MRKWYNFHIYCHVFILLCLTGPQIDNKAKIIFLDSSCKRYNRFNKRTTEIITKIKLI